MSSALHQTWSPFVLVTGLLLLGLVAADDGLFRWAGAWLERLPGPPAALLVAALTVVAVTTAILNLDTAVVFLTPILVIAARHRGVDEAPFLYGTVFVANAASLFLPGSNLTNLLVVHSSPGEQSRFAAAMLPAALATTLVTIGLLLVLHRRALRITPGPPEGGSGPIPRPRLLGAAGALVAGALMVALSNAALPVLALGLAAAGVRVAERRMDLRAVVRGVGPPVLLALFALATVLGGIARSWAAPGGLVRTASAPVTAAVAALLAILVNNLPATMLLTATPVAHPSALLLGLNVGPNLAVTGSLAAYLWARAARSVDAQPSVLAFSRQGIVLAPAAIAAGLAAIAVLAPTPL